MSGAPQEFDLTQCVITDIAIATTTAVKRAASSKAFEMKKDFESAAKSFLVDIFFDPIDGGDRLRIAAMESTVEDGGSLTADQREWLERKKRQDQQVAKVLNTMKKHA